MTDGESFDKDTPFVRYEMVFPKKQLLPGFFGSNPLKGNEPTVDSGAYSNVADHLSDQIDWEPHVDKADRTDYIVAVSSGIIAGIIDILLTGEFSLDRANEWGSDKVEKIVLKVAKAEGYNGDDLNKAIKTLEDNHPLASDGNTNDWGGGRQHHFRDFAHHLSIGGLAMSIFTQFSGLSVGTDTNGALAIVPIPESHRQYLGKNTQEKIVFGTIEWFFHMVSDAAGSSSNGGQGTGIPGPLLSLLKEFSSLPFFKDSKNDDMSFRLWLSKLFNGTLLADHDANGKIIKGTERRFDLRTEIGILEEIGRMSAPVLINQCIVRGAYFCRRLFREIESLDIRSFGDLGRIAPEDILPWGTPAMHRMVTVSSGVFSGIDFADALVRAIPAKDPVKFFLRINYVGVASFVVACVVDAKATFSDRKLEEGERPEDSYERKLASLGCLKLDFEKARVLHSIMYQLVAYDIELEKRDKRKARKQKWLEEWSNKIIETTNTVWAAGAEYFLNDAPLYDEIERLRKEDEDDTWLWLVAMEAARFEPYRFFHRKNDRMYKGLKPCSNYAKDVFCVRQGSVSFGSLKKLDKAVGTARSRLDGSVTKGIAGAAGTVVVVAVTGGFAFYFAPVIAPVLAAALGAEIATLSGAALTSASLAFLGGGALATGGAGMAGGTMLIAGGGALLGAIGGSSASAALSIALATDESYTLEECAKLIAFSEEVLIKRKGDLSSANEIGETLSMRTVELETEIEAIKRVLAFDKDFETDEDERDNDAEISPKKMLKILERSQKYLKRSNAELTNALEKALKEKS
ncbi:hypothetical protein JFX23_05315 [Schaalia cardiffensis]|uniref:hypothetical protein n=1 Tax=Schaalia cardiffensis TaxID=181487 RepID=UPI0018E8806E|nr:hypothetical protein [Schaalia cardiffensis]MBJ2329187.1 hypothetical protein [Schaalia cardiffensis]